jgi:hypothetical protein
MRRRTLCTLCTLSVVVIAAPLVARAQGHRGGGGAPRGGPYGSAGGARGGLPRLVTPGYGTHGRGFGAPWRTYDPWCTACWPRSPWSPFNPAFDWPLAGVRRRASIVRPRVIVAVPAVPAYGVGFYETPFAYDAVAAADVGSPGELVTVEGERRVGRSKVIDVGPTSAPAADALTVERIDRGGAPMLRLRWSGDDETVREVQLVVADSSRRVLAVQRVMSTPYTAVFDGAQRVAFVGVTLVHDDNVSTTTLIPVAAAARRDARR